jgi:hypothetical protein
LQRRDQGEVTRSRGWSSKRVGLPTRLPFCRP